MPSWWEDLFTWVSRDALDIEGLGEETARQLVDMELVRHLPQLFDLTADQLIPLEGFAELSADNLIEGITRASHAELPRFLYGLGIPEVGVKVAKDLSRAFGSLDNLRAADEERLMSVPGVGPRMSEQILAFFAQEQNTQLLATLLEGRVSLIEGEPAPFEAMESSTGPMAGLRVVFTGGMETLNRRTAKELVEGAGGFAVGSVSKNTDLVVAGENAGTKLEKAESLGIEVISEAEFLTRLQDS